MTIGNRLPHPGHPAPPQQQNPTLTGLLNNPPQGQAGMSQQQQPGNPMGQPQPGMPVMHGMQRPQMPGQLQPGQPQQRMPMGPQNPIWKGALQWTEKTNQQNAINRINCSVTPYQANPQVVKILRYCKTQLQFLLNNLTFSRHRFQLSIPVTGLKI